jgi:CzcA family heavy metal efflux pump
VVDGADNEEAKTEDRSGWEHDRAEGFAEMLRWIVGSSLKSRFIVIGIAAAIMVIGINRLQNTPVDLYPEFDQPSVQIETEALGLSAEEVEGLITIPLEADLLNGVAWVQTIRSQSIHGMSLVTLIFEPGTDLMRARQMVQERLTQVGGLPHVAKPPVMLNPMSSTSRVMQIGLSSESHSLIDLSILARWTIVPRLMGTPGVANVSIWGERRRQLQVQVDPERLREEFIPLNRIIATTGNALWVSPLSFLEASTPGTGGFIDTPNQRLGVRHELPISSAHDLAQVNIDGTRLRLGDVAQVVEDHQLLIGDGVVDDQPGLLLVVDKFPWANTLTVTREVDEVLNALSAGLPGVTVNPEMFRSATFVEMSLDNLTTALTVSVVLLVLVVGALLFNWRTVVISLVAIPLSLLAAALVLYLLGTPVNTLLWAGLVMALVVAIDDAIIDVENITRRLHQRREEGSDKAAARIIIEASLEMRRPAAYATLVILLAVIPVFFLAGLPGAFLKPVVLAYGAVVLASMVVALTVTPALSLFLLSKAPLERRESPLVLWLRPRYDRLLSRIVRAPRRPAYLKAGIVVAGGVLVLPLLGRQLEIPLYKETDLLITWEGGAGASRLAMQRVTERATRELRAIPGVKNVAAHIGRAVMSPEVIGINSAALWVRIDPRADYEATLASIEEVVDGYPGLDTDVLTYSKARFSQAEAQTENDIFVRVYGHNWDILQRKANDVQQLLSGIDGIIEASVQKPVEEPVVEIELDLEKGKRYGLKPGDVRRAEAVFLSGLHVGDLFQEQKVFDVMVWGAPETRTSPTSIRDLMLDTPDGGHVRLGDVADVRIVPQPNAIKRDAVSRYLDVEATVSGRDFDAVAREIESSLHEMDWPLEYYATVLGEYAKRRAAQTRVTALAIAAAIGIFLLLQACFESWRLATATFIALPAALAGGVLAVVLAGGMLSLGSLLGLLVVLGLAARNSVMLIHHCQQLERRSGGTFGPELVEHGARERFGPIVITAVAALAALMPFAVLGGGVAGLEVVHPMALVILGGLVTSTLLCLFVVPALYMRFGSRPEPEMLGR